VPVLLAGDFNQTADEFFEDGFPLQVTRDMEDFRRNRGETQSRDGPLFWTPWGTELDGGSYYYRENWESIDHFFLSGAFFDGESWDYGSVKVLKGAPWTGNSGTPQSFNPQTGNGLSDHVPLLLTLTLHSD
jgi:endonuclease/exonuclease/phosphatase family metal-dependent hydrolase